MEAHTDETAAGIATSLRVIRDESAAYWATIDTPSFLAPIGHAWSPADNVRHLTKSIRALAQGMSLPRWVVRLAFGRSTRPSRSYAQVRAAYLARLAQGADAGKYAPTPRPAVADAEAERQRIMAAHDAVVEALAARTLRWPEDALDRCRAPHPLLGRLTVREMLLFTLYHNRHHVAVVQTRRGERSSVTAEDPR